MFVLSCNGWAFEIDLYQPALIQKMVVRAQEKPMLLHIWGVSCSECVTEMPQWAGLLSKGNEEQIIFLQVDETSKGQVMALLKRFGFKNGKHYTVADAMDERQRYSIHPDWFGETPVTIIFKADGSRELLEGAADFKRIKTVLGR
jgi:thiol-disulfide isomerase/thioredoxin